MPQRTAFPARVQAFLRRGPNGGSFRICREHVPSFWQKWGERKRRSKAHHVVPLQANVEVWWCRSLSAFQDNTIDFLEFVAALNLVFRGDLEHKLRWSFKVYDKDNNGYVDRSEVRSIIDVSLWKRSATVTCVVVVGHLATMTVSLKVQVNECFENITFLNPK